MSRRSTMMRMPPAVTLLFSALLAAGCSTSAHTVDKSHPPEPAASGVATVAVDAKIAAARDAVMRTYVGYLNAETSAAQTADYASPELSLYTADPLLGQLIAAIDHLHRIGAVQIGAAASNPTITSLKLTDKMGTATVRDCIDESSISIVYQKTNKVIPLPDTNKRYVAITTAYLYPNGQWLFSKAVAHRDEPC